MTTIAIDKSSFDAAILARASLSSRMEPRREQDGAYLYECYDDDDGREVGFVTYQSDRAPTYTIHAK